MRSFRACFFLQLFSFNSRYPPTVYIGLVFFASLFFLRSLYLFYFLTVVCLNCCTRAFSSHSERGLLFIVVLRLLIAMVSLVAEHGCRFDPWDKKIPWSRKQKPTQVFLSGKFPGQRSLAGYSSWGHKEY